MKRLPRARYVGAVVVAASALLFGCVARLLHKRGWLFDRDDPLGYYVYLRSLVHDGDLDFTNEFAYFAQYPGAPGPSLDTVVSAIM